MEEACDELLLCRHDGIQLAEHRLDQLNNDISLLIIEPCEKGERPNTKTVLCCTLFKLLSCTLLSITL